MNTKHFYTLSILLLIYLVPSPALAAKNGWKSINIEELIFSGLKAGKRQVVCMQKGSSFKTGLLRIKKGKARIKWKRKAIKDKRERLKNKNLAPKKIKKKMKAFKNAFALAAIACGDNSSGGPSSTPTPTSSSSCGNGIIDTGEECDDGNIYNGDGCGSNCRIESYEQAYYVDKDGAAAWDNCAHNAGAPGAKSGPAACALQTANKNAVAGDTIYIRGGAYVFDGPNAIDPVNTGTALKRMTFTAYTDEKVNFVNTSDNYFGATAVDLDSRCYNSILKIYEDCDIIRSYITVHGIYFIDFQRHVWIKAGDFNEISHCVFSGTYDSTSIQWRGSNIINHADYNWIHDSKFEKYGEFRYVGGKMIHDDHGVLLEIGFESGEGSATGNVLENNIFQYGGHHVLGLQGRQNVVRGNYIQNNKWASVTFLPGDGWAEQLGGTEAKFGNRVLAMMGQIGEDEQNLIEGNRVAYGDRTAEKLTPAGEGVLLSERWNIFRYNNWYQNSGTAMFIHKHSASSDVVAEENYIYNNGFWSNGHAEDEKWKEYSGDGYTHAILIAASGGQPYTSTDDNVFKNNLFYQNDNELDPTKPILAVWGGVDARPVEEAQTYANNWIGALDGDPKFKDISGIPDPENPSQFDFNLQSDSGAIDGGGHLAQTIGSGVNSATLIVNDAKYFQDGWGNGAGGGAVVEADWIAIGTVGNVVQIYSIDYDTGTITLVSPMTWTTDAPVWLSRKSDSKIVLHGNAPDQGAHEFME